MGLHRVKRFNSKIVAQILKIFKALRLKASGHLWYGLNSDPNCWRVEDLESESRLIRHGRRRAGKFVACSLVAAP
jgi:hypothetical protein